MTSQENPVRHRRPTIRDVAALAGVSAGTVSQVVNGRGRISAPTAARVRDAALKLDWRPSVAASGLRQDRSRTIAIALDRPSDLLDVDPHFTTLISGIESQLAPRGYGLLLQMIEEFGVGEAAVYRRLATERGVDGVVLTDSRVGDSRYDLVRELSLAAVLVGSPADPDAVPFVAAPEPTAGIRAAVEHLVGLGHRRLAYVTGPDDRVHTGRRREALATTLRDLGVAPADVRTTDFTADAAIAATRELLSSPRRPTAILYANDSMALCGAGAAQRAGYAVPGDVSIVGHDNLDLGRWTYPGLTTVDQHVSQVGAAAALRLLRILGEDVPGPEPIDPPSLVVRESTGPVPREER